MFLFSLTACSLNSNKGVSSTNIVATIESAPQAVKIGYCPTMEEAFNLLKSKLVNVTGVTYPSAGAAFVGLYDGDVEGIIVGRTANASEISEQLSFLRKQDGLTLISKSPGMIYYDDLVQINIHTAEQESHLADLLPEGTNVIYHESLADALRAAEKGAVLVKWSQVMPQDKLLIPVDKNGNKISTFRNPHFYYLNHSELDLIGIGEALMP